MKEDNHEYNCDVCKRCDRPIMQDSQGNWFAYSEKGGAV